MEHTRLKWFTPPILPVLSFSLRNEHFLYHTVPNILTLPVYLSIALSSITSQLQDAFLDLHILLSLSSSLLPSPIQTLKSSLSSVVCNSLDCHVYQSSLMFINPIFLSPPPRLLKKELKQIDSITLSEAGIQCFQHSCILFVQYTQPGRPSLAYDGSREEAHA